MSIRRRLLLFLLPPMIACCLFISFIFAYNWHGEILDGFKTKLTSAVISCAGLIDKEEIEDENTKLKTTSKMGLLYQDLSEIKKDLDIILSGINHFYTQFIQIIPNSFDPSHSSCHCDSLFYLCQRKINF